MKKIKDVKKGKIIFVSDSKVDQFFDEYDHPENLIIIEDDSNG